MAVTLLLGASPETVLGTLSTLSNELTTVRVGDKWTVFNQYLRWANDARGQLHRLITPEGVARLVLTRRHWVLQGIDPAAHDALMSLLQTEVEERMRAFDDAHEQLSADTIRWRHLPGRFVVPDTNIFLHHEDALPDLDWRVLVGALELEWIQVVLPLLVIDELDRAKRGNASARARLTLRTFDELFAAPGDVAAFRDGSGHDQVRAHLLLDDPAHVRLPHADSELVDRCRALAALAGREVTLVTFDTGMALRARSAGLAVRKLTDPGAPTRDRKRAGGRSEAESRQA